MCRLFGALGERPVEVARWLLDAPIPFVGQANIDPEHLQSEGWGIAWYPARGSPPEVVKGADAVYEPSQLAHFHRVARPLKAPLVIAHLRKASNPLDLPRAELVSLRNTQPFLSGGSVLAHNGVIRHPRETLPRLGARAALVQGENDSEVLHQLLLHLLEEGLEAPRAYARAMVELQEVWEACGRPAKGPYGGLNLLFTPSSTELWAFCYYTGEHGPCLSGICRPYYEMSYRREGGSIIVTSEPMDRELERWTPIRCGEFVHARLRNGRLEVDQGAVPGIPPYPLAGGSPPEPSPLLAPSSSG